VRKRFGPFTDRLLAAYPPGTTTVPRSARNLMRDVAFGWNPWAWARLQARTGQSSVFYYDFDQHPERGDPNGAGVPEWPRFTDQRRDVIYFRDRAFPGPVPGAEGLEALEAYFAWRRTPEGKAWAK